MRKLAGVRCIAFAAAIVATVPALHAQTATVSSLPDAPDRLLAGEGDAVGGGLLQTTPKSATTRAGTPVPPCPRMDWGFKLREYTPPGAPECRENPLQMVVTTHAVQPLTSRQKGDLAVHNVIDPFNLLTITGYAAIYVAADSHSPYGPGFKGWGRYTGYSLAQDVQGQFFGVYAIPSLAHEDPRYHRLPNHPVKIRIIHAIGHTILSQHDDGSLMPNYAVLLTYPITTELSTAYVPGISSSGSSVRNSILLGYATNPVGDLISEFLPDIAKHVHVRVVFVQQIINQVAERSNNQ